MLRNSTRYTLFAALTAALLMGGLGTAAAQSDAEPADPTLNQAVIAGGVEAHQPVGTEGPFVANGERVYVFLDVNNPGPDPVVYTVNWHHVDRDRQSSQTIEAGRSPRWRTWVYRRATERTAGSWRVEVVAPNGDVQAELDFTIVPEEAGAAVPSGTTATNE